jgi:hypothetical protein
LREEKRRERKQDKQKKKEDKRTDNVLRESGLRREVEPKNNRGKQV